MRLNNRTRKQTEANLLDLDLFRAADRLGRFANEYRDEPAREMANVIDGMRYRIRAHMHPEDRVRTTPCG